MYAELQITSNFSFLRGASHPDELAVQAAHLGYKAFALTDRNTLAGIVRAHAAAKKEGIRLIPACRLDLQDGPSLLAYPTHKKAYAALCTLLSTGNLRTEKGSCLLYKNDLYTCASGMQLIVVPPDTLDEDFNLDGAFERSLQEYKEAFGASLSIAATRRYHGDDSKQLFQLAQLSKKYGVPLVATNDVHYHIAERRQLQDVLTCIREKCTIYNAGFRLLPNAERYLKPAEEMQRLFRHYPQAIEQAGVIADACRFSLDELEYEYPEEITTEGRTPQEELTHLVYEGAKNIFGMPLPAKTARTLQRELAFIREMNYAAYFLTVHDIVRFARSRGILCQGRGSAANSTVCFCLGITSVNPEHFDLLFERFVSPARNEPPDIDVDFEHERREEVIQYIYEKYGRDRAAIVATVTQQHGKGAIRDVGKAMGLSLDAVGRLASAIPHHYSDETIDETGIRELGFDPSDPHLKKVLQLTQQLIGFPRQLGQHTGGFVITNGKLTELCPVLNARMPGRTCIEWNKDDIDALGFMKIDVLALGMLTCIRKAFDLAKEHKGLDLTLANIRQEDPAVYEMIGRADTIGVFQIESRAQQTMLPRLKPKEFYDLVIEVAIVRPGPIQGDMVHPYLRRRNNEEEVSYPSQELKEILHRTMGVPLFQEQAMKIAIVAAGFTAVEADELRRSMATFRAQGVVSKFRDKLVNGMVKKGYAQDYAERVFKQLEGFGSYGFPESHAASFALLVYVSSWLKCHHPDVFACALLNSMPMGFYQPAQIVQDARKHGVPVLPVDINYSAWDHQLVRTSKHTKVKALRLGFRTIKGMRADDIEVLLAGRIKPYNSINALRDAGVSEAALERLADADAFRSLGLDRRQALWEVSTKDRPQALFAGQTPADAVGEQATLPRMQASEHVVHDYATTTLSLKEHPVSFLRDRLSQMQVTRASELVKMQNGQQVKVAGLVLVRQRPGTAKGIWFMTIEDETGFANLVFFPNVVEQFRKAILRSRLILVEGTLQIEGIVVHVLVQSCHDASSLLRSLAPNVFLSAPTPVAANDTTSSQQPKPVQQNLFGESRNFK